MPIYAGLTVVRAICAYKFLKSLKHLVMNLDVSDENAIMLAVLNLIDVVMIANLLTMVQIGGYESFVSRLRIDDHPDRTRVVEPCECTGIEGKAVDVDYRYSSIHLLQTFINSANLSEKQLMWQCLVHVCFLILAIAMAWADKIVYGTTHKPH